MKRSRDVLIRFLPAILLVAVALFHQLRTATTEQSAWGAGGGFGMFSTLDFHGTRTLRITIFTESGSYRVDPRTDAAWLARVLPTTANLARLADQLYDGYWLESQLGGQPRYRFAESADVAGLKARRVEVELWRREFNPTNNTITTWRSGFAAAP